MNPVQRTAGTHQPKQPLLCLVGPTACGKTEIALELARRMPAEIISCDSMQVYRGMPILTQAMSPAQRKRARTHLMSFLDPSKEYSAAEFRRRAGLLIPRILKNKRTPLIVGGTGLYLRALLDGLFESPEGRPDRDPKLREKLVAEQEKHGGDHLHRKLAAVDPAAAKRIHPNDIRRLVRALEVCALSGGSFTEQRARRSGIRGEYDVRIYLLDRERDDLYARVHRRVDAMVQDGLLREVRRLRKKKLSQTAEVALGYREMCAYLDDKLTMEEALELLKKNTRHYAKRQLSWFRHENGVETVAVARKETAARVAARIAALWKEKR